MPAQFLTRRRALAGAMALGSVGIAGRARADAVFIWRRQDRPGGWSLRRHDLDADHV